MVQKDQKLVNFNWNSKLSFNQSLISTLKSELSNNRNPNLLESDFELLTIRFLNTTKVSIEKMTQNQKAYRCCNGPK